MRAIEGEPDASDLVQRRWSWPGQNGKPVYNFRSEGREFASVRCLIPAEDNKVAHNKAYCKRSRSGKVNNAINDTIMINHYISNVRRR